MNKSILWMLTLSIILVACSSSIEENDAGIRVDSSLGNLDYNIEEEAWSPQLASVFEDESMQPMMEAYEIAIHNEELIQQMPCYCGCESQGHEHNQDCFVYEVEGNIATLDQMGFG